MCSDCVLLFIQGYAKAVCCDTAGIALRQLLPRQRSCTEEVSVAGLFVSCSGEFLDSEHCSIRTPLLATAVRHLINQCANSIKPLTIPGNLPLSRAVPTRLRITDDCLRQTVSADLSFLHDRSMLTVNERESGQSRPVRLLGDHQRVPV